MLLKFLCFILGFTFLNSAFSSSAHNIYNAKGHLVASCIDSQGCQYFVHTGLSQTGVVKQNSYQHYTNGPTGKIAILEQGASGVINTTLLVTDFHTSVVAAAQKDAVATYSFDSFGNSLTGNDEPIYTDKFQLENTDLYNFYARFYDPTLGRFISPDPVAPEQLNWYYYGLNSPLYYIDPDGQMPAVAALAPAAEAAAPVAAEVTSAGIGWVMRTTLGAMAIRDGIEYAARKGWIPNPWGILTRTYGSSEKSDPNLQHKAINSPNADALATTQRQNILRSTPDLSAAARRAAQVPASVQAEFDALQERHDALDQQIKAHINVRNPNPPVNLDQLRADRDQVRAQMDELLNPHISQNP